MFTNTNNNLNYIDLKQVKHPVCQQNSKSEHLQSHNIETDCYTSGSQRVTESVTESQGLSKLIVNKFNVTFPNVCVECNNELNQDDLLSPAKKIKLENINSTTFLNCFNAKKVCHLDPQAKKYYFIDRWQRISKLKSKLLDKKMKLSDLYKISCSNVVSKVLQNLDSAGVSFIESQIKNCTRKRPLYTSENKALY